MAMAVARAPDQSRSLLAERIKIAVISRNVTVNLVLEVMLLLEAREYDTAGGLDLDFPRSMESGECASF
jgi:hypothetical protein